MSRPHVPVDIVLPPRVAAPGVRARDLLASDLMLRSVVRMAGPTGADGDPSCALPVEADGAGEPFICCRRSTDAEDDGGAAGMAAGVAFLGDEYGVSCGSMELVG